ncbi:STAS domain-containing protein [Kitasatospora sp. NRRL B-11411]|uniref:STAS domain-containing protein n=1 Tax=Kitasatospora sp. NRRL B-11411 TaxID=1463822 RepID=UPI0012FEB163|nr:STAS domain-containing protein [Kitasatospora sp. NRRL B-11411]
MALPQCGHGVVAAPASGPGLLVLNLELMTFCDSSGLNAFVRTRRILHEAGTDLVLTAPTPPVARLLGITWLCPRERVLAQLPWSAHGE